MYQTNCRVCKKPMPGMDVLALRNTAEKVKKQIKDNEDAAARSPGAPKLDLEPLRAEVKAINEKVFGLTICDDCKIKEEKEAATSAIFSGIRDEMRNLSGGIGAVLDELRKVNANLEKLERSSKRKE